MTRMIETLDENYMVYVAYSGEQALDACRAHAPDLVLLDLLKSCLVSLAKREVDTVMPGYTHLQKAQPILLSHYLLAFWEMLDRDEGRLIDCFGRLNALPLGSAALAGTGLKTDRRYVARLLKFSRLTKNSVDAVSDRDFVAEFIFAAAMTIMHMSRMCEDLVIWSSGEFGFVEISDAFATGSSIMPQKKEPRHGRACPREDRQGVWSAFQALTLMKGLPSGYNRDMQEDREYLWDALSIAKGSLKILASGLSDAKINKERMKESVLSDYSTATELANYLVREKGLAFRRAYEITGRIVKQLCSEKKDFRDTQRVTQILRKAGLEVSPDALYSILDPASVASGNRSLRRDVSGRS